MEITITIQRATEAEFAEIMEVATPLEAVVFRLARDGTAVHTAEMVPEGQTLVGLLRKRGK